MPTMQLAHPVRRATCMIRKPPDLLIQRRRSGSTHPLDFIHVWW
jgi:hypothetical protein